MAYDTRRAALEGLVNEVMSQPDIAEGLQRARYSAEQIREEIAAQSQAVWEVASDEVKGYENAERTVFGKSNPYAIALAERTAIGKGNWSLFNPADIRVPELKPSGPEGGVRRPWMFWVVGLVGILIWGLVLANGPSIFIIAGLIAVAWGVLELTSSPMAFKLRYHLDQLLRRADPAPPGGMGTTRVPRLSATDFNPLLQQAALRLHIAPTKPILLNRVRQLVTAAINKRLTMSYDMQFRMEEATRFAEVFDHRLTIPTPARTRLEFMLNNMSGGSIGIAGPRGAGKTTLLKLFCGPKRVIAKLHEDPVLGMLVCAPVAYEARDFILYLYSTLCQTVIEAEDGTYKSPRRISQMAVDVPTGSLSFTVLRRLPRLLVILGVVGLGLSTGVASVLVAMKVQIPAPSPATNSSSVSSNVAGTRSTTPAANSTPEKHSTHVSDPGSAQEWLSALKVDPSALFYASVFAAAAGLFLAELLQLGWWPRLGRSIMISAGKVKRRTLQPVRIIFGSSDALFMDAIAAENAKFSRPVASGQSALFTLAEELLREIKFQQTYTSGWSGALKLPVGLEGGTSRAVTLAATQQTLPDVVYSLTSFLLKITEKYKVIIGIDELDKLATDKLARRFLNDIKSLFGLERCFYLVSVSENALSHFDRRGMPVRDAFDSSFDDFIYVDHLDFELSRALLEQRLVGRPIPFFALSYCMSGGLARDLIRSFRYILELYEMGSEYRSLQKICDKVITADLDGKIRAIRNSTHKLGGGAGARDFLTQLYTLELSSKDDEQLCTTAACLLKAHRSLVLSPLREARQEELLEDGAVQIGRSQDEAVQEIHEADAQRVQRLAALVLELATYLHFAVTMRQFFNDKLTRDIIERPKGSGSIDGLAKVRQILGIHPDTARVLLGRFRAANGLPELVGDAKDVV